MPRKRRHHGPGLFPRVPSGTQPRRRKTVRSRRSLDLGWPGQAVELGHVMILDHHAKGRVELLLGMHQRRELGRMVSPAARPGLCESARPGCESRYLVEPILQVTLALLSRGIL